jgi:hypothetical protein
MHNEYYHDDFCMFPGSYFGEEMFILNNPRSSRTFIALKDVTVCVIDKELFTSDEIFKPAVDQLACDVSARLKVPHPHPLCPRLLHRYHLTWHPTVSSNIQENIIRDAQGDSPPPSPCGREGLRCMMSGKKNKKRKKVLWERPDDEGDEEDDFKLNMQLPACACGLLSTF